MDAEKETGVFHNNISKAAKGKIKTSGGYHWKYLQDIKSNDYPEMEQEQAFRNDSNLLTEDCDIV